MGHWVVKLCIFVFGLLLDLHPPVQLQVADFHGVHLGTPQQTEKERKRNSRSNSKSSSQSSPSYGCTVKGASAIILTPDSIVYNDDDIWSHRYDTSPRP